MLTGLPDPLRRVRVGGEPEELEIISQYMKAIEDVEKRSRKGASRGEADEDEAPKAPNPKGAKGAKGDQ